MVYKLSVSSASVVAILSFTILYLFFSQIKNTIPPAIIIPNIINNNFLDTEVKKFGRRILKFIG